jgi:hypothetical protein
MSKQTEKQLAKRLADHRIVATMVSAVAMYEVHECTDTDPEKWGKALVTRAPYSEDADDFTDPEVLAPAPELSQDKPETFDAGAVLKNCYKAIRWCADVIMTDDHQQWQSESAERKAERQAQKQAEQAEKLAQRAERQAQREQEREAKRLAREEEKAARREAREAKQREAAAELAALQLATEKSKAPATEGKPDRKARRAAAKSNAKPK